MSKPQFFFTDVFTRQRYGGNQLATFVDCESLSDAEMQQIAREINFSETTFITSRTPRDGGFDVRIFTPTAEVEFAGHPTLGTAYVIREMLALTSASEVVLNLPIGRIPVRFLDGPGLWMQQVEPEFGNTYEVEALARMLGISGADIDADFPVQEVSTGFPTIVVPVISPEALKRIKINRDIYFTFVEPAWAKLILVFCRGGYSADQDLSVRVFAEYYGIAEDAATGSSNGALAAYLARHRYLGSAEIDVRVGQGHEIGRPSTLGLRAADSDGGFEVHVGGSVVGVAQGVWGG